MFRLRSTKKENQPMTLDGIGKIVERKTESKGKKYKKLWIYIPSQIANDSAFPFQAGEKDFKPL